MGGTGVITAACTNGSAAAELHARRASATSATCSYRVSAARPKHRRAGVKCKVAQTEVAESPEAPEELSEDIIDLLRPRTVPTPVLDPQEVCSALNAMPECLPCMTHKTHLSCRH